MQTSNYRTSANNPNAIAITAKVPKHFKGPVYQALAPDYSWLRMRSAEYDVRFFARLKALDPKATMDALKALVPGEPILLCYEDVLRGEMCHRRAVAEWFELALDGVVIPELGAPRDACPGYNDPKGRAAAKAADRAKKAADAPLSLFAWRWSWPR